MRRIEALHLAQYIARQFNTPVSVYVNHGKVDGIGSSNYTVYATGENIPEGWTKQVTIGPDGKIV